MKFEPRYVVLKLKDLRRLPPEHLAAVNKVRMLIEDMRWKEGRRGMPQCLVIESDWPEYNPACEMLKARVEAEEKPGTCPWPSGACICPDGAPDIGPFNKANMAEFTAISESVRNNHPLHVPRERLGSDTFCSCPACDFKRKHNKRYE